jgi:hypothetical protein
MISIVLCCAVSAVDGGWRMEMVVLRFAIDEGERERGRGDAYLACLRILREIPGRLCGFVE